MHSYSFQFSVFATALHDSREQCLCPIFPESDSVSTVLNYSNFNVPYILSDFLRFMLFLSIIKFLIYFSEFSLYSTLLMCSYPRSFFHFNSVSFPSRYASLQAKKHMMRMPDFH